MLPQLAFVVPTTEWPSLWRNTVTTEGDTQHYGLVAPATIFTVEFSQCAVRSASSCRVDHPMASARVQNRAFRAPIRRKANK